MTDLKKHILQEVEQINNTAVLNLLYDYLRLIRDRPKVEDWKKRIHSDPNILSGKPVIKGTRLSVEFLLERLANGWTTQDLLENYPRLEPEDIQAIIAYRDK